MGFKKYEEGMKKEEEVIVEEQVKKEDEHKEFINNMIEENTRLQEEMDKKEKSVDEETVIKDVELARAVYKKVIKKWKILGIVSTAVGLAIMAVALVLFFIFKNNKAVSIIALVLCIVAIAIMGVVSFIKNKDTKNKALEYVNEYFVITNKFIYSADPFKDVNYKSNKQYSDEAFKTAHLYKNLHDTKSRNYCELSYNDMNLVSCDIAANVLVKGRTSPMFLGKLYTLERPKKEVKAILENSEVKIENTEEVKNSDELIVIFQLKGGELSKPLDCVDDLEKMDETDSYIVYSNSSKYKKVFNSKVLNACKDFRIDKTLIDVVLSIRDEFITLGIDYSDDFISIPVESECNIQNIRRTKNDLELVTKVFDLINENSK